MGHRINISNAGYAPVSVNSDSTYTPGTKVPIPGLMTIDLTLLAATGELYGDGALTSKLSKLTGATLKFGHNKLSLEDRAAILGHTYSNGVLSVKTTDVPAEIAFYFEMEHDDGKKEQIWLLSGKADPTGVSAKQSEANITFSTDEMTINFVRANKTKEVLQWMDTSDSTVTDTMSTAFAAAPTV